MCKTNEKVRYTLRMPTKYAEAIKNDAEAVGTTMASIILHIFAKHYNHIPIDHSDKELPNHNN